jgi:tRNA nucleotidyltransferase/poly(A) polymerase
MNSIYKKKYLKYKNKYIELKKQRGGGNNYSWFIIDTSITPQTIQEQDMVVEQGLEAQYNNGSAEQIIFDEITYFLKSDGNYINSDNTKLLRREQKITITDPNEQLLFNMLKDYIEDKQIVLRVAGGWVRDKILGKENDDIDFTVANIEGMGMSGKVFSDALCEHINGLGDSWKCKDNTLVSDKAANLETATLLITVPTVPTDPTAPTKTFEFELDFVGFRSEVYKEDSRNPVVSPGTILQDTERRDFTINALYYNIHTGKIEDHIGGVRDIHRRIIRTPIDTTKSFTDDPLRILRALRFSARFKFALDEDIKTAMRNKDVQEKFKIISGGRIGQEILGFFKEGSNPILAFREIYECDLWNIIFGGDGNWGESAISLMSMLDETHQTKKELMLVVLTQYFFNLDPQKLTELQEFMTRLNIPRELSKQITEIHKCTYAISEKMKQKADMTQWKLSDFALIIRTYHANFDDAITFGRVLEPALFDNIDNYIKKNKLKEVYATPKFDSKNFANDFRVSGKQIKILVDLLYEWQFDNSKAVYEEVLQQKDIIVQQVNILSQKLVKEEK